jgi:hypothetical protein
MLPSCDISHEVDQIKSNEVGRACGTHGRGEKGVSSFWWESLKERGHSEDQGVDRRMDQTGCLGYWLRGWTNPTRGPYRQVLCPPFYPMTEIGFNFPNRFDFIIFTRVK